MSRLTEREIARRLAEPLDAEPPEDLLTKIKAEIPPAVPVGTQTPGGKVVPFLLAAEARPAPRRQRWLIAASLAVMMGGGLLAWQILQVRPMEEMEGLATDFEGQKEMPPPPPAASRAPMQKPSPGAPRSETEELDALGYVGGNESGRRDQLARPRPASPAQPVEVPESFADEITVAGESPRMDERRISMSAESVEDGVEGGVEGGVPGGIVGGTIGGVSSEHALRASPLRISRGELDKLKKGTTGGNAEPNDEPYGDNFFRTAGTNPFVDTAEDPLSTFGLDVDTASYTVARRYLQDGNLPDPDSVRVEEFVNFFDYGDAPPENDDFAIRAEGAPTPFAPPGYRLLRFNVRGRQIKPEDRKPAVLTFVVDVSGSMDMENRLDLVKRSLELLLSRLKAADKVGLVVYGDAARVLLEPTHDLGHVRNAIKQLHAEGSTNAEAGLLAGYDLANRYFRPEGNNRIVLCSDGVANVGTTGPQSILDRIGREARKGIELTTLGFGMGNYNDVLMEQLADKGDGRYAYLDTLDEARRVLVEELEGTLETIAKDTKVQVAFNPEVVDRWRLLGYENRDIADEKFRDDTVDAGEIGAGHSVTALYEVRLKPGSSADKPLANLHLRWRSERTGRVREEEKLLRVMHLAPSWERSSPALRLASVVAEFAEILRGSYWAKGSSLNDLFQRAQNVSGEQAASRRAADVAELVGLIGKAARLQGAGE